MFTLLFDPTGKAIKVLIFHSFCSDATCGLWLRQKIGLLWIIHIFSSFLFDSINQVKQLNIKTSLFSQCLMWLVAKAEIKDLNVACVASVSRLIPPHKGVKFLWRRILIFTCNYGQLWQPTFLTYGHVWSCRWELFGMTNIWNSMVLLLEKVF